MSNAIDKLPILHRTFEGLTERSRRHAVKDMPIMRHITMVGALFDDRTGNLSSNDTTYLQYALNNCIEYGIPIARDFTVAVRNLAYGDNFHEHPCKDNKKTDLLISAFVYNPPQDHTPTPLPGKENLFLLSPKHYLKDIWALSAARSGAKIIIAHANSKHEIGPDYFARTPFLHCENLDAKLDARSGILIRETIARKMQQTLRKAGKVSALSCELDRVLTK